MASLRRALIQRGSLHGHDRDLACMFTGFAVRPYPGAHLEVDVRTRKLAEFTADRPPSRDVVCKFIQERYHHTPDDAVAGGGMGFRHSSDDARIGACPSTRRSRLSMQIATTTMAPLFDGLHWRVEITDAPVLWTSDRPVMPWLAPFAQGRVRGARVCQSRRDQDAARFNCNAHSSTARVAEPGQGDPSSLPRVQHRYRPTVL